MDNTRYVYFNAVENGGLYLYGDVVENVPADAIRWQDFQNALVQFGIPSLRTIPMASPTPPPPDTIAELETACSATVNFATFELYQRRFNKAVRRDNVGRVVKTWHERRGITVVVMGTVTAVFVKLHREYTSHADYGDKGNASYNKAALAKLRKLRSAVNGLDLNEKEKGFLMGYYQNLLASY